MSFNVFEFPRAFRLPGWALLWSRQWKCQVPEAQVRAPIPEARMPQALSEVQSEGVLNCIRESLARSHPPTCNNTLNFVYEQSFFGISLIPDTLRFWITRGLGPKQDKYLDEAGYTNYSGDLEDLPGVPATLCEDYVSTLQRDFQDWLLGEVSTDDDDDDFVDDDASSLQKTVRLQRLVPFLFKIHPHLRVHQHFPARLPASKRSCCPVHFLASARSPVPGCTNRESVRKRAVKSKPRIELIEVTGERTDSPEELSVYLVGEWE